MAALIPQKMFDEQLAAMDIENFAQATIRQVGAVGGALEKNSGHRIPAPRNGRSGPSAGDCRRRSRTAGPRPGTRFDLPQHHGHRPAQNEASRFVKAFLDIDVAPEGCIPTVGSMQGRLLPVQISSQCDPKKTPFCSSTRASRCSANRCASWASSTNRSTSTTSAPRNSVPKLESYLKQGNVAAIIYSNPNNPAWICLTESELRTIGELANEYDTIVLEDLAYMGMDFRKGAGTSFPGSVPGHRSPLYG